MNHLRRVAAIAPLLSLITLLQGCSAIGYYAQAISGHLEVMRRAVPIDERLQAADTPEALRVRLARVLVIREFASRELALPDNGSYRRYAEIGRPFAVWNVFAAPEFSLEPKESCFPIAGCVRYRGFYAEAAAQRYADELRDRHYDVYVGGVPAYSTLGWFDDPVLSTFINYPEAAVARLIFHELAHQVAYVKGDSTFNESFAVAVEEEGVKRWQAAKATEQERAAYQTMRERRAQFLALVQRYRERLAEFYARPAPDAEKREGKALLFARMRREYESLRASWSGFAGYDRFFARGANNALLASVTTYTELVPAFRALLARSRGDLRSFYTEVKRLARLDKDERNRELLSFARAARAGASIVASAWF